MLTRNLLRLKSVRSGNVDAVQVITGQMLGRPCPRSSAAYAAKLAPLRQDWAARQASLIQSHRALYRLDCPEMRALVAEWRTLTGF